MEDCPMIRPTIELIAYEERELQRRGGPNAMEC